MSEILTTSLQVNFGDYEDQNRISWEEDREKDPPDAYHTYVRLYPTGVPIRFATAGTLTNAVDTSDSAEEVLVFSGNTAIGLRYPNAYNVTMSVIGYFYNDAGEIVTATLNFDTARNEVVCSKAVYAAVSVSYTVNFTSFLYAFEGGPCGDELAYPYLPVEVSSTNTSPYKEAVLVALDPVNEAVGSLQLTPPDCDRKEFHVNRGQEARSARVSLSIDPQWPIRLSATEKTSEGTTTVSYLASRTKIRLSPSTPKAVVAVNNVDAKIKKDAKGVEEDVSESVQFDGSTSTNLSFQPKSGVGTTAIGVWRNKWGNSFSPDFRTPGQTITEVDWVNERTYRNPRRRTVGTDEIVVVDMWGRAVEAFGVMEATYTHDYDLYDLRLPYDSIRQTFDSVYVTAVNERAPDQIESDTLYIEAPSLEGTK